eukprot:4797687-Pyramimonas_sp.AAC.1
MDARINRRLKQAAGQRAHTRAHRAAWACDRQKLCQTPFSWSPCVAPPVSERKSSNEWQYLSVVISELRSRVRVRSGFLSPISHAQHAWVCGPSPPCTHPSAFS